MSNRIKRNIFLVLSIIGIAVVVARAVDFFTGGGTWWELLSAVIIYAACFRFYLGYRRAVRDDADASGAAR